MLTVTARTELLHLLLREAEERRHHVLTGAVAGVDRGVDVDLPVGVVDTDLLWPKYTLGIWTFTAAPGVIVVLWKYSVLRHQDSVTVRFLPAVAP